MSPPLRILFAGSGEFGLPTLRGLLETGHAMVGVYSQPDRPAGRGRRLTPTPVAQFALERGLSLVRSADINREPGLPAADVMVVIAFGQKIGDAVVRHARLGAVNLHASRLPKYRGAAPIHWALIRGETVVGNSVIRLAPRMDAGEILGQSALDVGALETTGELHDRLAADGAPLVNRVLSELAAGTAAETPQDESRATLAPKLTREQTALDWGKTPAELGNQIRGMFPWPGCRVSLRDAGDAETARLTLVRARSSSAAAPASAPGCILADGRIAAGDGSTAVELIEVQPEGGRPMPLADFRRGHRWDAGMRLRSIV